MDNLRRGKSHGIALENQWEKTMQFPSASGHPSIIHTVAYSTTTVLVVVSALFLYNNGYFPFTPRSDARAQKCPKYSVCSRIKHLDITPIIDCESILQKCRSGLRNEIHVRRAAVSCCGISGWMLMLWRVTWYVPESLGSLCKQSRHTVHERHSCSCPAPVLPYSPTPTLLTQTSVWFWFWHRFYKVVWTLFQCSYI